MGTLSRAHGFGAVLVAVALGLVGGCAAGDGPGLTYANFERIKEDGSMTEEEVNKLLGSTGVEVTPLGKHVAGAFEQLGKGLGNPKGGGAKTPSLRTVRWGNDNRHVICTVAGGKVTKVRQQGL